MGSMTSSRGYVDGSRASAQTPRQLERLPERVAPVAAEVILGPLLENPARPNEEQLNTEAKRDVFVRLLP